MALLDAGVQAKAIIGHRFCLQALAASSRALPTEIDYDQISFTFELRNGERRLLCKFSALSGWTEVTGGIIKDGQSLCAIPASRLSMTSAPSLMLWLFPIEEDFTWWERLRTWFEQQWMKVRGIGG